MPTAATPSTAVVHGVRKRTEPTALPIKITGQLVPLAGSSSGRRRALAPTPIRHARAQCRAPQQPRLRASYRARLRGWRPSPPRLIGKWLKAGVLEGGMGWRQPRLRRTIDPAGPNHAVEEDVKPPRLRRKAALDRKHRPHFALPRYFGAEALMPTAALSTAAPGGRGTSLLTACRKASGGQRHRDRNDRACCPSCEWRTGHPRRAQGLVRTSGGVFGQVAERLGESCDAAALM